MNEITLYDETNDYQLYLNRLPEKKRQRILQSNATIESGVHAIAPMICCGPDRCRIIEWCPLPEIVDGKRDNGPLSSYPVGQGCVMEKLRLFSLVRELSRHLGVDGTDPIEKGLVNELALIDLYKQRAQMFLAKGDRDGQGVDFMRIDTVDITDSGKAIETSKHHPIIDVMDKLEKRRAMWLDRLNETRKSKADLMVKMGGMGESSKVLREIEDLRKGILALQDTSDVLEIVPLET